MPAAETEGATASPHASEATSTQALDTPTPQPTVIEPRQCSLTDTLTPEQQVGQLFMLGVDTSGLSDAVKQAVLDGQIGSVVLLGNSTAGSLAISSLTSQVALLGDDAAAPILVAVDQEGGQVQRLKGQGFSTIPNAQEQGKMSAEELRAAATGWGLELADAGVHYNLAPVADVVPADKLSSNAPIGALRRNFGTDAHSVGSSVAAFVEGMSDAGIATSLKHFPGLGEVTANTDFDVAVDDETTAHPDDLASFVAGLDAGASSVMISSAIYEQIDPDVQGVFSSTIITDILRGDLGFEGVVISDDLGAAKSVADISASDRATRFIEAGGDLLINADPSHMAEMTDAVVEKAQADAPFAEQIRDAANRVLLLKEDVGLVDCG